MWTIERTILRDATTIAIAAGVIGISFGVLAAAKGISVVKIQAMSLLVFAGGSQFALIAGVGSGLAAAVVAGLLLNARHIAYGMSLSPVIRGPLWRRAAASQVVIDESTAYALAQPDSRRARQGFYAVGVILFVAWQAGTAIGAVAGGAIDADRFGLDAAFPAGLLALLWPQLADPAARIAAAVGVVVAVAATPFLPSGGPIILASIGALAGMASERVGRP